VNHHTFALARFFSKLLEHFLEALIDGQQFAVTWGLRDFSPVHVQFGVSLPASKGEKSSDNFSHFQT
jgi:hypothetical protein